MKRMLRSGEFHLRSSFALPVPGALTLLVSRVVRYGSEKHLKKKGAHGFGVGIGLHSVRKGRVIRSPSHGQRRCAARSGHNACRLDLAVTLLSRQCVADCQIARAKSQRQRYEFVSNHRLAARAWVRVTA